MSKRTIKLWTLGLIVSLVGIYGLSGRSVGAFSAGPLPSRTGAPALGTFPAEANCTQCHRTNPEVNSGPGRLTIGGLPQGYSPNQEFTVTVMLTQEGRSRYGFQLTALDDSGNPVGTLTSTDTRTRTLSGAAGTFAARLYIEHTLEGTNQGSWSFLWRAPAAAAGRVTFYVAGNAADGSGTNTGDFIYTNSASIQPAATSTPVTTVSAASFSGTVIAPDSIAAGYGVGLATGTESATTVPLPTTLAGTTVRVNERAASLFFVSGTQVNFLVPAETAPGAATVTITSGSGAVSTGTLQIAAVGPGLFTANTNGQGVPAAVLLRVRADGSTAFEPLLQRNAANTEFVPLPIDLGPETDQVFLILFGTGIRFRSALAAVTVSVGGTNAEVGFAGPADGFIGLDQVNARLPRSLAGRGNVDVVLTADGRAANTVTVNVR